MLKKRILTIIGLTMLTAALSACGNKEKVTEVQVTPTPEVAEVTPTAAAAALDMQETTDVNVIGTKTDSASRLTIVNSTGDDIAALYVREHPSDDEEDDDEWGSDLINSAFTLKNTETATYYYEKPKSSTTYDIRITYTDEDRNECFFRDLPMTAMEKITLRMNGSGDDSFPYATYTTAGSTKEHSTMSAVKKRLGLTDDSDTSDEDDSDDSESTNSATSTPTPTPSSSDSGSVTPTSAPSYDPTSTPEPEDDDPVVIPTIEPDAGRSAAEDFIGISWATCEMNIGSPEMEEYESDDNQGTTGYHYYSTFTVSTAIDDDGEEIVTGVW